MGTSGGLLAEFFEGGSHQEGMFSTYIDVVSFGGGWLTF
jgi:hypothetical protein